MGKLHTMRCGGHSPDGQAQEYRDCWGKLVARMTLSEAVETWTSILPLQMSERQALNLIHPVGEALREWEDEQAQALFEQVETSSTQQSEHSAVLDLAITRCTAMRMN